jgi:ABC-2 type transport system permease protein
MHKTWLIISREYVTRVRKKSFILLTLLGPVFFALIMILPVVFTQINAEDQHILVKDDSGLISALPDTAGIYFHFDNSGLSAEEIRDNLYNNKKYDAFLYIPLIDPIQPSGIRLYSNEQLGITTRMFIEQVLADQMEQVNLKKLHLSAADLLKIRPRIFIEDKVLSSQSVEQNANAVAATGLGYIMGFLTYIVLLIYGSMVMRGVMEEKTNRIVEVMISTVKPFQLMVGKIIGIGAVGLTQFFIWGLLIFMIQLSLPLFIGDQLALMQQQATSPAAMNNADMQEMSQLIDGLAGMNFWYLGTIFIIFFLGGYFLYASLFAAVGSLVNDDDGGEVQMYSFPLTMLILVSIFITTAVIQQPDTSLAFWASIIPFSSPIVMPALIPFGIPLWHLGLSVSLLILGFMGTSWVAGRIYRTGILMYGKKIKLKEIWRWVVYKG